MKCHDTRHTGQSPYSTAENPYIEKWRFHFSGWLADNPVIDNEGTIYCKGAYEYLDRYLYAINPDGTEKWKYKTGGLILGSSPAIAEDGTIYFGSWDHYLYAINNDGTLKWNFLAHSIIYSSPTIAEDGTIYFGTMGPNDKGRVYAVNPNGNKKWHYETDSLITSDPVIGEDSTIYIGSQDSYLYALYSNGTLRWRFKTGKEIMGPPSIADDGIVYIGSWDDYLYALYPNNGTMKWRCSVGYGTATNPSIASDGTIYCGSDNLFAINPDGTHKWIFYLGSQENIEGSSPTVSADGTIYIGTEISDFVGGRIIAVNPDGTEKWHKWIAKKAVDSTPSIGEDGTVYIGSAYESGRGYLHAFGSVELNEPPDVPIITGPTHVRPREENRYYFRAFDSNNNPVSLYIDWGDGTTIDWTEEYASGEKVRFTHTFKKQGTHNISAKAKDVMGEESDWGYLEVKVPKNKMMYNSLLIRLLERFPILERFLLFIK
jgi:outer membrane protein assembly factor BamB